MLRAWRAHNRSTWRVRHFCVSATEKGGTGGFDLTFLGTSSQGGTTRYPSSLAMRIKGATEPEVWIFDCGEGAITQLKRSRLRLTSVRNVFVTHLHGDHLFGLPGMILSILTHQISGDESVQPLRVFGPPGVRSFLRLALGVASSSLGLTEALQINELCLPFPTLKDQQRSHQSMPYWRARVRALPYELRPRDIRPETDSQGRTIFRVFGHNKVETPRFSDASTPAAAANALAMERRNVTRYLGTGPAEVVAAPVKHTVPCLAYTVRENVISRRFDKAKLLSVGVPEANNFTARPLFKAWMAGIEAEVNGRMVKPDQVMVDGRTPRSVCIVGDTHDASEAAGIAENVDVLVHEATMVAAQRHTARRRGHSSTRCAAAFARQVGAKRLIVNHTSVAYSEPKLRALEAEARALFGADRAYVARDLSTFAIPTREEDSDSFVFRRSVGASATPPSDKDSSPSIPLPPPLPVPMEQTDGSNPEAEIENLLPAFIAAARRSHTRNPTLAELELGLGARPATPSVHEKIRYSAEGSPDKENDVNPTSSVLTRHRPFTRTKRSAPSYRFRKWGALI